MTEKTSETSYLNTNKLRPLLFSIVVLLVLACICMAPVAADCTVSHIDTNQWTKTDSLPTEAGSYYLTSDVSLTDTWTVPSGEVTLCLNGFVIRQIEAGKSVIIVPSDSTLNITDCDSTTVREFILTNNERIQVLGGVITGGNGEYGGGMYIDGGTVNLFSGNIAANTAGDEGGGVYLSSGLMNMYGGNIVGNDGTLNGGGIYVSSGSTFSMSGGNITKNSANSGGGIYNSGDCILTDSGVLSENEGGGVAIFSGTFTMSGGTICKNEAWYGAGVEIWGGGTFTQTAGKITENIAKRSGGGVYVKNSDSLFTMNGGSIENNHVKYEYSSETKYGGGVAVSNHGHFLMSDGSITGNTVDGNGGGVAVLDNGKFTMSGGSIMGNVAKSNSYSGGVYNFGTMEVSGTPIISENFCDDGTEHNLRPSGSYAIMIGTDGLQDGAKIMVSPPNSWGSIYLTEGNSVDYSAYFIADEPDVYTCTYQDESVVFTVKTYTVTWKNGDTIVKREVVDAGSYPQYTGETPTKQANPPYSYVFSGWTPARASIMSDTTYTAQFRIEIEGSAPTEQPTEQPTETPTITPTEQPTPITVSTEKGRYDIDEEVTIKGTSSLEGTLYLYGTSSENALIFLGSVETQKDTPFSLTLKSEDIAQKCFGTSDGWLYTRLYLSTESAAQQITDLQTYGACYLTLKGHIPELNLNWNTRPDNVVKGQSMEIQGTATETDSIAVYLFGDNFFAFGKGNTITNSTGHQIGTISLENGQFTIQLTPSYDMPAGSYSLLVQHPMHDKTFGVWAEGTTIFTTDTESGEKKALFDVAYVERYSAGDAVLHALSINGDDDRFSSISFDVLEASSLITAKADKEKYTISEEVILSGTSTAGDMLYAYIGRTYSTSITPLKKDSSSSNMIAVKNGNWEYTVSNEILKTFDAGTYYIYLSPTKNADRISALKTYTTVPITVQSPVITLNPLPTEITRGSKLTVSGTVYPSVEVPVTVKMLSTSFAAVPEETVGSASFISLTTRTDGNGIWEVTFYTTALNVDEYRISASFDSNPTVIHSSSHRINVIEGAPTTTPTETQPPTQTTRPTTLTLHSGWNFISAPSHLAASCDTAGELLAGIDTDGHSPLGYDAKTGWYTLKADTVIQPLDGYWIYAKEPAAISYTYAEKPGVPQAKPVYTGWNAVGLSADTTISAATAFSNLDWVRYLAWNLDTGNWGKIIANGGTGENSDEQKLTLGNGGWLYVETDGTYLGNTA